MSYGHCTYCRLPMTKPTAGNHSRRMATRDHVIPASRGGTKVVPCCFNCNNLKADMMPDEWAKFMADNPTWYWESFRPKSINEIKAAQRAEIFRQLRVSKIQPRWPDDVQLPPRPICRGLAA